MMTQGMIDEVIRTRSYNCELIIFTTNEGGTLMAANSIYNMHRFGWDHYIVIGTSIVRLISSGYLDISTALTNSASRSSTLAVS